MRMNMWFGWLCTAAFVVAGGCGSNPEVVIVPGSGLPGNNTPDASNTPDTGNGNPIGIESGTCATPTSCAALGANCGIVTDSRCGGVVDCGQCADGEICGAGGPNVCGTSDGGGGTVCAPVSCADLGADCGFAGDGCGALLDCGSCGTGTACGVTSPNVCGTGTGDGGGCTPLSCADQMQFCGPGGDGCGNVIASCGSCTGTDTCGGGGVQGQCGSPVCIPRTCADQNVACGQAGDGCGKSLNCGTCTLPQICGGGNVPGQCGCTGVCSQIPDCSTQGTGGSTTILKGKVYDPAGNNPLYHVLVYIPNNPSDPGLQPFTKGITCDQCGSTAAGDPLVSTYTNPDGTFQLDNVPVGTQIKLVIQLGKWRRQFPIDIATPCGVNNVVDKTLKMPSTHLEGDIPLTAMVTGNADLLECVLRKMGIADSEFSNPDTTHRIHFYRGDDSGASASKSGQWIDSSTPKQGSLFTKVNNVPVINDYDMVIMACQGAAMTQSANDLAALRSYANGGGRVFSTHYSYTWLNTNSDFAGTANWHVDENDRNDPPSTAVIDLVKNPKGNAFQAWLEAVNASTPGSGTAQVVVVRHDTNGVLGNTQQWLYRHGTNRTAQNGGNYSGMDLPLHFTFNAPVNPGTGPQCGRVLFSDFHVIDAPAAPAAVPHNQAFPSFCNTNPMNAQEKLLEFMIFDLGSCVQPYTPVCTPTTCAAQHIECGPAGDGCGNPLDCGLCPTGEFCGAAGPGKCGPPSCTPTDCATQGLSCGPAGNGCGAALDCGTCPAGQFCGGGGKGKCGSSSCSPLTCTQQNIECGPAGNGCGAALDCGLCPTGQVCGAAGPGKCGTPSCTPTSCEAQAIECGPAGDGCGHQIDCGNCPTGQICGAGGIGKCAGPK